MSSAVDLLLERLADPTPLTTAELLALAAPDDERVQALSAALRNREKLLQEDDGNSAFVPTTDDRATGIDLVAVGELADNAEALLKEVQELRCRNDELAAALGACYLCWGEQSGCLICAGRGIPGSSPPELSAYIRYVAPAISVSGFSDEGVGKHTRRTDVTTSELNGKENRR
jgi:hypothetical protein